MEVVSLSRWRRAMRENGLDTDFFAHQPWDTRQELPWALIDTGTSIKHLQQEFNRVATSTDSLLYQDS